MGKRKRATKPPPKKKASKLDKVFDCPFCGHEQTVNCYIERDSKVGRVECRMCGVKYKSTITHLDEEIDVYHKWLDACEEASKDKSDATLVNPIEPDPLSVSAAAAAKTEIGTADLDDDDEEDDFLDD